jgi:hypothetical protein
MERRGPRLGAGEGRFGVSPEIRLLANPFTNEFVEKEVAFYDLPKPYSKDGVEVRLVAPQGTISDYLNKNWRIFKPGFKVPALIVDGELWMSLTAMEIQSLYVPIAMAYGEVGTAGLGLGYFALRAAGMPEVEKVHVFEREARVADFFMERFGNRPEIEKIEITVGDARKEMLWKDARRSFDFVFMDVYQTMLGDDVVDDILLFNKKGSVETYRFWGQERVLLDAWKDRERPTMSFLERAYFKKWQETEDTSNPDDPFMIADLYEPLTDPGFRKAVFDALGENG